MSQGPLSTLQKRYKMNLIKKIIFHNDLGNYNNCSTNYLDTYTIKDVMYSIANPWHEMSQHTLKLAWTKLKINWSLTASASSSTNDELNLSELKLNLTRLSLNLDEASIQTWLNKTDCGFGFYTDDEIVQLINAAELEAQQIRSESQTALSTNLGQANTESWNIIF